MIEIKLKCNKCNFYVDKTNDCYLNCKQEDWVLDCKIVCSF